MATAASNRQEETNNQPGLVPVGGELPHGRELQTSALLNCLQAVLPKTQGRENRKRLCNFLGARTRVGMYLRLSENLHLAYADQCNGRGTQHWWRLFYSDSVAPVIEAQLDGSPAAHSHSPGQPQLHWGGMSFRSQEELQMAQALHRQGLTFFANSQGMTSLTGLPVTAEAHGMVERLEVDFLVFHRGACLALEIDGRHHHEQTVAFRDFAKERVLLKAGLPTVRFPTDDCRRSPERVVAELAIATTGGPTRSNKAQAA